MASRRFLFLIIHATKKTTRTSKGLMTRSKKLGSLTINKHAHDANEARYRKSLLTLFDFRSSIESGSHNTQIKRKYRISALDFSIIRKRADKI
jgi:hypothetical protein